MHQEPAPIPRSNALLLEVAWEVCNQVGGIYQVLRSKAELMMRAWGDGYCLVGPYIADKAATDFEPAQPPQVIAAVLAALKQQGTSAHFGRWLVSGRPNVILLEVTPEREVLNQVKRELWEHFQVETLPESDLVNNAVGFGHASAQLVAAASRIWADRDSGASRNSREQRVVAHFHEWQGGVAIPLIRRAGLQAVTLFTTHATLLGRYVASSADDLYARLASVNADAEAQRFYITPQFQLERACAKHCDIFTTVSPITGEECQHLLGRAPDVITPNGINTDLYDVGHEFQTLHAQHKDAIRRFVMGHFFPSYSFDLDTTLFFFTSGRFEPHNKGFDLCLESMARLNSALKRADVDRTVVFFIVTHQPILSFNPHALSSRGVLEELHQVSENIGELIAQRMFLEGAAGNLPAPDELTDEYWMVRFRRTAYALKSKQLPLMSTHVLQDEVTDPILGQLRDLGLSNAKEDRVKVVYHPQFINSVNPLWRIEYEQFVRGCHLGIFPSSYEPWGYTPLECVCMGVPAITSDLSGFGRYLADVHPDHDQHGITVLGRRDQDFKASAKELTNRLLAFCRLTQRQRIALRNSVEALSHSFDWGQLGEAYHQAHRAALEGRP